MMRHVARRRAVLVTLNITAATFLTVQILYWLGLHGRWETNQLLTGATQELTAHNRLHLTLALIESLQELAWSRRADGSSGSSHVELVVIDEWLLSALHGRGDGRREEGRNASSDTSPPPHHLPYHIDLAVIAGPRTNMDSFVSALQGGAAGSEGGISWSCDTTRDLLPMYITLDWSAPVVTNIICRYQQRAQHVARLSPALVRITVMYDHPNGYLWYNTNVSHPTNVAHQRAAGGQYVTKRFRVLPSYVSVSDSSSTQELYLPEPGTSLPAASRPFIPCNYTRAAHYYQRRRQEQGGGEGDEETGGGGGDTDLMHDYKAAHFKQVAKQLIAEGSAILDELDIPFWISSGTCLGWFRQCDVIAHSGDVDLGIMATHYKPELITSFRSNAFNLLHIMGTVSDSLQISFSKLGVKLDIYFFYPSSSSGDGRGARRVWNGATDGETLEKYKYVFSEFTLCWSELLGIRVRVPCNPHQYILDNYGPHWFEESRSWDWRLSPPNSRRNGAWNASDISRGVIQIF